MKMIVTGGAGFIGSHLVDTLISNGIEVHVIDSLSTGKLSNINPKATWYPFEINSPEARNVIKSVKPDAVFHLAAQADVSRSIINPLEDLHINVHGTVNLLQGCVEASVGKFIFSSTSAVYGDIEREIITELEPTNPSSFYGLSKLTAEQYIQLYSKLYRLPYAILRYANVYGPRQLPKGDGGVIAVFLERLKNDEPISIHGDGNQTRDFIYVKDVVDANIAAFEHAYNQIFHISTGKSIPINKLLHHFENIHEQPISKQFKPSRIGDIKHSCLANELAKEHLQWQPSIYIEEGLRYAY
ncbi:MAG: NAD-dependent epimerase/dehydratase family protein, partial [Lysinibacillus sp.]